MYANISLFHQILTPRWALLTPRVPPVIALVSL